MHLDKNQQNRHFSSTAVSSSRTDSHLQNNHRNVKYDQSSVTLNPTNKAYNNKTHSHSHFQYPHRINNEQSNIRHDEDISDTRVVVEYTLPCILALFNGKFKLEKVCMNLPEPLRPSIVDIVVWLLRYE